jgi:hypothetical protein
VVKTGGHEDQLSRSIVGLDLYRVYALRNLLSAWPLNSESSAKAQQTLAQKAKLYIQGCRKRGKENQVQMLLKRLGTWAGLCDS